MVINNLRKERMKMRKRILSIALTLVLSVTLLPGVNVVHAAGSATGDQIVNCAMQYVGKVPYVWGGKTIDGDNVGADCSGFICRIYEKYGFDFWKYRTSLRKYGTNLGTDLSVAQKGDIIWFEGHVAIYAGKSGGEHMIVHETGGKYQNVAYTKVSVVGAELKGIIRIPGITNNGSSTAPVVKPNVTITTTTDSKYKAKEKITDTNAVLVNKIVKSSGTTVSKMGVILYDASGNQIKKYSENISNVSASTTSYHSWYDVNSELGITLTPGTTYKYQFFGVFNGTEIKSDNIYSFQTTGTAPVKIYIVTFWLNESGSKVYKQTVNYGKTYGSLPIADEKDGYTFDGYYTAKTGGTKITKDTVFKGTSDITVYPRYTQNTAQEVTISYYIDGSIGMTQNTKVGDTYETSHFDKDGYTFKGWYSSETGGTNYAGTYITASSPRTLYAQYEKEEEVKQYNVYLYLNGSVYKTLSVTNGSTYGTLPTPSYSGYTFEGWYTSSTGGTKITSSTKVNLTSSQILYGRLTENKTAKRVITLQIGNARMTVDGVYKNIDNNGTVPLIRSSRTLLPVRAVFEAMGGTVDWNQNTKVVSLTKDGKTLYLGINNSISWDSSAKAYSLDSAPVIINNRTMLPIRFIVEYFDGDVSWNANTRTVTITY